jgi:hypothetical protein
MEQAAHLVKFLRQKPQGRPFSAYRRTFQMEQMTCNLIPQDGDSEFGVTAVQHKFCSSVSCAERWLGSACRLWGRHGVPWGRLHETACACTGIVATSVLNEHSWTTEKQWCSRSGLCEGLATFYTQRKMLHITQGFADQIDEEEMGESRGTQGRGEQ